MQPIQLRVVQGDDCSRITATATNDIRHPRQALKNLSSIITSAAKELIRFPTLDHPCSETLYTRKYPIQRRTKLLSVSQSHLSGVDLDTNSDRMTTDVHQEDDTLC